MQLPKVVATWLTAILATITAVTAVINGFLSAAGPTTIPLITKISALLAVVALVIRNFLNDFPQSSDPVVNAAASAGAVAGAKVAQMAQVSQ